MTPSAGAFPTPIAPLAGSNPMIAVSQLAHLCFDAVDPAAMESFAAAVLGLHVTERSSGGSFVLRTDEVRHRISVRRAAHNQLACIGWTVPNEDDLARLADQLSAHGIAVTNGTPQERRQRHVEDLIKITDPSGWQLEICYGLSVDAEPFRSPLGFQFVTGDQGLGHVVIGVDDFEKSMDFYRGLLGFRTSDFVVYDDEHGKEVKVAFLRCNRRHHSVAFGRNFEPAGTLSHFMLQLADIDDVGRAYDIALEQGVRGMTRLGRHPNERSVSFYMPLPCGGGVELGWGARTVDNDAEWHVGSYPHVSVWGHGLKSNKGGAAIATEPVAATRRAH